MTRRQLSQPIVPDSSKYVGDRSEAAKRGAFRLARTMPKKGAKFPLSRSCQLARAEGRKPLFSGMRA